MAISALFPRWVPRLYFGQRGDFGCDKGWFDGFRASFAQVRWYPAPKMPKIPRFL